MYNATPCQPAGLGDYESRAVTTTQSFPKAAYMPVPTVRPFLHSLGNLAFIVCYSRARTLANVQSVQNWVHNPVHNPVHSPVHSPVQSPESRFCTIPNTTTTNLSAEPQHHDTHTHNLAGAPIHIFSEFKKIAWWGLSRSIWIPVVIGPPVQILQ